MISIEDAKKHITVYVLSHKCATIVLHREKNLEDYYLVVSSAGNTRIIPKRFGESWKNSQARKVWRDWKKATKWSRGWSYKKYKV